jgi:Protein of unknown function (DUF1475)
LIHDTATRPPACDREGVFCRLRTVLILVAVAFTAALSWASFMTPLWSEFSTLASTWSLGLTIADVYLGILLISLWVVWRECSAWRSALWIVAFIGMGNIATYAYVVWALRDVGSARDMTRFFHGRRHAQLHPETR